MKKMICGAAILFAGILMISQEGVKTYALSAEPECKAAYSCDFDTETVIYAKDETKRLPIASMCKIMTLLLSFESAESGAISYDDTVTVSENAAGMGGSQVFLEAGLSYPVKDLLKSITVCSANDSCVAIAEHVAGSEEAFIQRMNARAKELGAVNTLFANCTGLPKEPQYSCAKDVAIMLKALLQHEKYFEFSKIWLEDFHHPDGRTIQMTNTNKLVKFYNGCDGGKTGFTNEAGSCLAATAKRGDMRILTVVIGAANSKSRNAIVSSLFDEAFASYENKKIVEAGQTMEFRAPVSGSKMKDVAICAEKSLTAFEKKGDAGEYNVELCVKEGLCAPLRQGDVIGEAILYREGVEISRTNLISQEEAPAYTWWDALGECARSWN